MTLQWVLHRTSLEYLFRWWMVPGFLTAIDIVCDIAGANHQYPALLQRIRDAVIESGTARFRAIVLTSFTTAAGLIPIMLESDPQAQAIIPTAISIGYGIVFATIITLFLVPCLYLLQEDGFAWMRNFKAWLFGRPATDKTGV